MSQTIQSNPRMLVESVARILPPSAADDFRNLMNEIVLSNLTSLSPGGNLIKPGGSVSGGSSTPAGVTFSVQGANGVYAVSITDPSTAKPNTIWHEVSYCTLKSFTRNVFTLSPTLSSGLTVQSPAGSFFFRLRSSFDKKTWSEYQLVSTTAIAAGLIEASAISAGAAFNQTNFAVVASQGAGSSALVTIGGTGGPLTPYAAVRGAVEQSRPSATVIGVTPQSEQFVGWDGSQFLLKPTLASVLADNLEPVGKVSVVSTGAPVIPTIVPVLSGTSIVGYNVTSGGSGASEPYTLLISGPGSGATAGAQTIVAGVLISVAPGNPGSGYNNTTTVTPIGGSGGGQSGGGTAAGGNGGRLTDV